GDGIKKDPLVINFNGTSAQLTNTKFSFDLDSDGNGVIDNGSELFGTKSSNGFADLAAYDSNHDHWIDANDPIYAKLRIWSKDAAGQDTLNTLAQRNIGALYLGNAATPFGLKNASNELQGQLRSTGVYIKEDGSAGTMQQVDLVA
ncbi:MAG: hypothetical protein HY016_11860, partial [Nitrosomonadales bacterium]|nr:hypothetical protein [Nitrosomonadales bacterium]